MGIPPLLATGTWSSVEGAYYTGAGSGEIFWLVASLACCVVAIWVGHRHETKAYEQV